MNDLEVTTPDSMIEKSFQDLIDKVCELNMLMTSDQDVLEIEILKVVDVIKQYFPDGYELCEMQIEKEGSDFLHECIEDVIRYSLLDWSSSLKIKISDDLFDNQSIEKKCGVSCYEIGLFFYGCFGVDIKPYIFQ